jgi:hypothetical protein
LSVGLRELQYMMVATACYRNLGFASRCIGIP